RAIKDIKEQEVYFGEIPLMTDNGTFIINGTERVIVSQLHRSPGVFYDHDKGKTHSSGKVLYSARVIPYRGSWLDFEFDHKDILYVRIDRRRKMPATVLLKALGYSTEQLLNYYYKSEEIYIQGETLTKGIDHELLTLQKAVVDVADPKSGEVIVKANRKYTKASIKKMVEHGIKTVPVNIEGVIGRFVSSDIVDPATGEILVECNEEITEDKFNDIKSRGVTSFKVLFIDNLHVTSSFRDTLLADKISSTDEALIEIYRRLRPGDPPTLKSSLALFDNLFFNPERYDLSAVGRLKLNFKLGLKVWPDCTVLNAPSMFAADDVSSIEELVQLLAQGDDQFSKYLLMKLPGDFVKALKKHDKTQPVPDKLREQIIIEFNNLVKDPDLFQKDAFANLNLNEASIKLTELIDQGGFDENR